MIFGTNLGAPDFVEEAARRICIMRQVAEGPTEAQILLELQNSGYTPAVISAAFARANTRCPVPGQLAPPAPRTTTTLPVQKDPSTDDSIIVVAPPPPPEVKPFPWKVVGLTIGLVAILGTIFFISTRDKD